MKVSELIQQLSALQAQVGDAPVFFQDNYNRLTAVGCAIWTDANDEHTEWDETLLTGQTVIEIQQ